MSTNKRELKRVSSFMIILHFSLSYYDKHIINIIIIIIFMINDK